MLKVFFQGLLFGLAYVAPIGMQNLYVINTAAAMNRLRAYQVALITIFFDISLALACFFGVGVSLSGFPLIKNVILLTGCLAVIYIGFGLLKSVPKEMDRQQEKHPLVKVASICFAVTWLNPQAIIDGTLLLGGIRASLAAETSGYFMLGASAASFTWFLSLTTIVSISKNILTSKILRYINIICGLIIIFYGIKLGYTLIRSIAF